MSHAIRTFFASSVCALLSLPAYAVEVPQQLNYGDLADVTEILGYNTSSKFLSNPYPLGGFSGLEIGFTTEIVNTTDLELLGAGTSNQNTFQYNRITVGKGLYQNLDFFVHFVPFSSSNEVSEYGGMLKWGFFESKALPFTISTLAHISTINIQDRFSSEVVGVDLMGGLTLRNFSIYFGGGTLHGRATFSKNVLCYVGSGICVDSQIELNSSGTFIQKSTQEHAFVGIHAELRPLFFAAQIDRYEQPVYSAKIGLRY